MKKELDIQELLKKAEELKALFVLGQRVIPFLEEIFLFIQDTSPLIQEISSSIKDNLKKMPKASKQLSKVTEATEMATNEIMDTVDGVMYKSGIISTNLALIRDIGSQTEFAKNEDFLRAISNSDEVLKSIKNDAQNIMMALQVQDITSQQIAAVNNLLETLQTKLGSITDRLKNTEFAVFSLENATEKHQFDSRTSNLHRTIAFDPDAVDALANTTSRQQDVDDLMKHMNESPEEFSREHQSFDSTQAQDDDDEDIDIDALFAANTSNNNNADDDDEDIDIDALFAANTSNNNNADDDDEDIDIDALFAANAQSAQMPTEEHNTNQLPDSDEPFSQDDIDALFK